MLIEAALIVMLVIGIGLIAGLLVSAIHGNLDNVVLFGVATLTGLSTVLGLICAIVMAVVFGVRGDGRKAVYSIAGFVLGLVLWVGVISMLAAAGVIEGGA